MEGEERPEGLAKFALDFTPSFNTSSTLSTFTCNATMTIFRPCIDLHAGFVKQIVGGTLSKDDIGLKTNFQSEHPAAYYAELYKKHKLKGGHVIMLGPSNDEAAIQALGAWPQGLQVGGGIKDANAKSWVDAGASKV